MCLAEIDWTNAVFLPLLLQATLGLALAIYSGLIASRMVVYAQEIQRGRELLYSILDRYHEMSDLHDEDMAYSKCAGLLLPVLSAMRDFHGQEKASQGVALISIGVQNDLINEWKEFRSGPDNAERINNSFNKVRLMMEQALSELNTLKPDYWVMFNIPTFGRMYGRLRARLQIKRARPSG